MLAVENPQVIQTRGIGSCNTSISAGGCRDLSTYGWKVFLSFWRRGGLKKRRKSENYTPAKKRFVPRYILLYTHGEF